MNQVVESAYELVRGDLLARIESMPAELQPLLRAVADELMTITSPWIFLEGLAAEESEALDAFVRTVGNPASLVQEWRTRVALAALARTPHDGLEDLARQLSWPSVHEMRNQVLYRLGSELSHLHLIARSLHGHGVILDLGDRGNERRAEQVFDLSLLRLLLCGRAHPTEIRRYQRSLAALSEVVEMNRETAEKKHGDS
ncbi:MAG: hypothetical protein MI919_28650 [Holophagales bacterium]|nr:hypothetical protein [Holophagales bacterium]